jgi:hypothetical protein
MPIKNAVLNFLKIFLLDKSFIDNEAEAGTQSFNYEDDQYEFKLSITKKEKVNKDKESNVKPFRS